MVPVADLKNFYLFKDLTEDQVKGVAEITELKKYKRGEDVYRRGAPAKRLFLIKKGTVSLRRVQERVGISFVSRAAGELLGTLRVNMNETLLPLEFTEEGEEGLAHVVISWYGCDLYETLGARSHGESGAAKVFGRVQAAGSAGGRHLHQGRADWGVASMRGSVRFPPVDVAETAAAG
jgi:hypothetical protein